MARRAVGGPSVYRGAKKTRANFANMNFFVPCPKVQSRTRMNDSFSRTTPSQMEVIYQREGHILRANSGDEF